ncbi:MAG TPA: BON domain-containing protein [Candidatus Acidoferrales bacterium]|nr:BON domain-containing protein [Candidatus Acidoferrales bacterium]
MPASDAFKPYVGSPPTEVEKSLHDELLRRFGALEPQMRPWYGVGMTLHAARSPSQRISVLIVSPTHIVLAHAFAAPGVSAGIVHGSPAAKEWWLETTDRRVERIGERSPFEAAKSALHAFLPQLDGFLHARKIKNPYVQSILVFPDGYTFAGIQDVPVGTAARGAIALVSVSDAWQSALPRSAEENLDRHAFAEWLMTLLPSGAEATFRHTWIEPSLPSTASGPDLLDDPLVLSANEPELNPKADDVITLTREAEWSFDEPRGSGPSELEGEELSLPEARRARPAADERVGRKRPGVVSWLLRVAGGAALALLVVFIGHEVYMYLTPTFPSTPYWQETAPPESEPAVSSAPSSPVVEPAQDAETTAAEPKPAGQVSPETPPLSKSDPAAMADTALPPAPAGPEPIANRPPPIKPAAAGHYETIRPTLALDQPRDSASVVDRLRVGTRLNVVGSDGDWLIVRSRTRNATVYVRRDDAMLMTDPGTQPRSPERMEQKWKETELQIREEIVRRGVPNVTVSFIGDTAYLRGNVRTADEREQAELAAKTIPEVKYVHNGIWVSP